MRLIDRYLLRELLKVLLAILLVLSLMLSSLGLAQLLEKAALGDLNPQVLLPLMGFQMLRFMARAIPAVFFLTILVVLGRLYRDSEMTALAACGIGTAQLYRAIGYGLLPLAPLTAWLAIVVQPWAAGEMEHILAAQKQDAAELVGLRPGRFNEYSQGELVFYIEDLDLDKGEMRNVFIQNRQHQTLALATAALAHHRYDPATGDHFLTLYEGQRYVGDPGQAEMSEATFRTYTLRIAESTARRRDARAARPTVQLLSSTDVQDRTEFWERISYPLSLISLALLAIPLSRSLPRQGIYGRLFLAFLVYFAFFNLHALSVTWMKKQTTPEWIGIWWVQILLLALTAFILLLELPWTRRQRRRWRGITTAMSTVNSVLINNHVESASPTQRDCQH